jgi:polar amino acid transport system substrate-binding protein
VRPKALVTLVALGLWIDRADAACELVVRANSDPPYFIALPQGEVGGVGSDAVREALRRAGCTVTFVEMPFARALQSLRDGSVGVLANVFRNPEREAYAWFSAPYNKVPNRLFIRRTDQGRWRIERLADLIGTDFRLGVQIDVVYSPEYRGLKDDPHFQALLVPVSDRAALWQMLAIGRIDGVIADELTAHWELEAAGLAAAIGPHGFIATADVSYVAFSRKLVSADLVERFDEALASMRRDGTLAEICAHYHLQQDALNPDRP